MIILVRDDEYDQNSLHENLSELIRILKFVMEATCLFKVHSKVLSFQLVLIGAKQG